MPRGRLLRQLIKAGASGAPEEFREVAAKVIQEERGKNHHLLANDLERILYGQPKADTSKLISSLPPVPVDRERNLPLLEVRDPIRSFDDIVLESSNLHTLKQVLLEQARRDVLGSWGLRPISRLLLVGPPGCGKTLAAEVLGTELGLPLVVIRFDAVVSSFLGETAANLRKVFDYLVAGRYLALFDEFDAVAKEREDATEHGELRRVVNAFLQMLDSYRGDSLLVAASNHEGMLDRALWRRFDEVLVFRRPGQEAIVTLIEVKLRGVRRDLDSDDLPQLAKLLLGMSHADIERVLIRAIKSMILSGREFLTTTLLSEALHQEKERRDLTGDSAGQQRRKL